MFIRFRGPYSILFHGRLQFCGKCSPVKESPLYNIRDEALSQETKACHPN